MGRGEFIPCFSFAFAHSFLYLLSCLSHNVTTDLLALQHNFTTLWLNFLDNFFGYAGVNSFGSLIIQNKWNTSVVYRWTSISPKFDSWIPDNNRLLPQRNWLLHFGRPGDKRGFCSSVMRMFTLLSLHLEPFRHISLSFNFFLNAFCHAGYHHSTGGKYV